MIGLAAKIAEKMIAIEFDLGYVSLLVIFIIDCDNLIERALKDVST